MLRSTAATDALRVAQEKLAAAERGENVTPRAPSAIPMSVYYHESEREQNLLIAQQEEHMARLERAGMMQQQQIKVRRSWEAMTSSDGKGGNTAGRSSSGAFGDRHNDEDAKKRSFLAQRRATSQFGERHMSMCSLFFNGGAGGRSKSKAGMTPKARTPSFEAADGVNGSTRGGSIALVRRQSSIGGFGLIGQQNNNSGGGSSWPATPASPGAASSSSPLMVTTTTTVASPSPATTPSPIKDGAAVTHHPAPQVLPLQLPTKRLKPIYNPYNLNSQSDEAAARALLLRPATLQLLKPLSFEEASRCVDLDAQRTEAAAAVRRSKKALHQPTFVDDQPTNSCMPPTTLRDDVAAAMVEWRRYESLQIEVHRRREVDAIIAARDGNDTNNRREKGVLAKVAAVQQKASALQEAKLCERQRIKDLETDSNKRVAMECLESSEGSFRARLEAAQWMEWQRFLSVPSVLGSALL